MSLQSPHLSYADATAWRAYQGFFPERLRLSANTAPAEEQLACDRVVLHVDRYQHADSPLKIVLLHGGGSYSRLISPYAVMINQLGYEVVVPDLPGYGLTQVARRDTTYDSWVASIRELALHEHRHDGLPLVLVGIGQGGMLALHVASHVEQVKAVAATALLEGRATETIASLSSAPSIAGPLRRVIRSLPRAADNLGIPMRLVVNTGALSNNQALVSVAQSDPQGAGIAMPVSYMRSWMNYKPPVEPTSFDRPVLLTHAAEDRWTPLNLSLPLFDRLTCPKRLVVLERAGHIPIEQPGLDQYEEALGDFLQRLSEPSKRQQPLGHALAHQATGEHEAQQQTRPSRTTATDHPPGPAAEPTANADDRPDHDRPWQTPDALEQEIETELARGREQRDTDQSTAELLSLAAAFEQDLELSNSDEMPRGITIWQNLLPDGKQTDSEGRALREVPHPDNENSRTPSGGGSAA